MAVRSQNRYIRLTRQILDNRLLGLGPIDRYAAPERGWIRTVRESLGMSAADLAGLMGVTEGAIRSIERNEQTGGVRLQSLRRAAAAMDCSTVFVLIPNHSLEYTAHLLSVAKQRPEVRPGDLLEKYMPKINAGPTELDPEYWSGLYSGRDW